MTRIFHWILYLRHKLFHSKNDMIWQARDGEMFLRCTVCMMRSPGVRPK